MNKVRITAIRQTVYPDLMAKYENPIEHTCDVREGQQWISENGECPEGMCPSAWSSMREFVESLARGEGNFFAKRSVSPDGSYDYYDGWMKNPMSAYTTENNPFSVISYRCSILCAKVQKIRRNNADFFENGHFFDLQCRQWQVIRITTARRTRSLQ